MYRWRKALFALWFVAMAASVALFFVPWQFVIPGYKFPYHGRPALLAACLALAMGSVAAIREWRGRWRLWPWAVVCGLLAVEIGFQVAFALGPEVATAKGTSTGPWGETPIQLELSLPVKSGFHASAGAAVVAFLTAVGMGLAIARRADPGTPLGDDSEVQ